MTPDQLFSRLSPFIRDYIYRNRWQELREIQVAAGSALFETESNLLLSSGTASGKTEAAMLPVLTLLHEKPPSSVGVLYVSPLKALINDQFFRLEELLAESDMPVTRWHGDVPAAQKRNLLARPRGVLQITPESLEGILTDRPETVRGLFGDLRFVVIDEIHSFMTADRGTQLLCLLERMQRIIKLVPRRIGLSATLGDLAAVEKWLCSGTGRDCVSPSGGNSRQTVRIALEHFTEGPVEEEQIIRPSSRYIYRNTLGKRCIIFANSRQDVEFTIAQLKMLARSSGTPDFYLTHHGSVSASLRTDAETRMKSSDEPVVVGATVTLELGIDIGALDRIVQIGSPPGVSSFLQRIGRSGRRGGAQEMFFALRESVHPPEEEPLLQIDWELIKCIAVIQLYAERHWIEPLEEGRVSFSLLYHQTMSILKAHGEMSPSELARYVLTLTPFRSVTQEQFKLLLRFLLEKDQLQRTETGGIIIGMAGERVAGSFQFYSVFADSEEFTVVCGTEEIGTVQQKIPEGEKFTLAGRTWEVVEADSDAMTLRVRETEGFSPGKWSGAGWFEVHTEVVRRMRKVLTEDLVYPYLGENAVRRLSEVRKTARAKLLESEILPGREGTLLFPWLGTRELAVLERRLRNAGLAVSQAGTGSFRCLKSSSSRGKIDAVFPRVLRSIQDQPPLPSELPPRRGKYDAYLPPELRG